MIHDFTCTYSVLQVSKRPVHKPILFCFQSDFLKIQRCTLHIRSRNSTHSVGNSRNQVTRLHPAPTVGNPHRKHWDKASGRNRASAVPGGGGGSCPGANVPDSGKGTAWIMEQLQFQLVTFDSEMFVYQRVLGWSCFILMYISTHWTIPLKRTIWQRTFSYLFITCWSRQWRTWGQWVADRFHDESCAMS